MHLNDKDKYKENLLWNTFYLLGNDLIQDKKETGNTN